MLSILGYIIGDIDSDVYQTALELNHDKLNNILREIDKVKKELSNSEIDVDAIVTMCCKLGDLWENSPLQVCTRLQNLVFPDGILWDKKIGNYRTLKINEAIAVIARISDTYKTTNEGSSPSLVPLCG